eukprot:GHRR01007855.1.p1 GENE.GHRR01007855.1~~GHRR01007855.1.p1  ORF type:complete len:324 (+),score=153.51 GHRR01007855.1:1011-1982(+)
MDSPRAPVTPDPSENNDTDGSEQGSDVYCQQLISSCRGLGLDEQTGQRTSAAEGTDSLEAAMQLLLVEAGVNVTSAAMQAALRRYVMALLAATSGYYRPDSCRQPLQQRQQQTQQQMLPGSCLTPSSCSSCSSGPCGKWQEQQHLGLWQPTLGCLMRQLSRQQQCTLQYQQFEHHVPFISQCEHHMLPFHGTAHIAYLLLSSSASSSDGSSTGDSSVAAAATQCSPLSQAEAEQLVSCYTRRLQVQERITHQLAAAVQRLLQPAGVMVVVQAVHMCMVARGVENHAGSTVTRAAFGVFQDDSKLRCQFLRSLNKRLQQQQQQA